MRTILIAAIAALAFASAVDAQGAGGGKHPQTGLTVHGVSADRASPCLACSKTPKGQVRRQRPTGAETPGAR